MGMEDKKQIEEMAKICEECGNLCNECVRNGYCTHNATNKNTANSPKDSVVLSADEFANLKKYAYKKGSKETAREIITIIKDYYGDISVIARIAKQYGVKVE